MTAVDSLAGLLAEHDPDHTPAYLRRVAGRVVAHWKVISEWCREDQAVEAGRNREERPLNTDDAEALEELAYEHQRNAESFMAMAALARRGHRIEYNPDEVVVEREDRRDTERAQDEAAARQAIRP